MVTHAQSIVYSHQSTEPIYPYAPLNKPDIIMTGLPMLSFGVVSAESIFIRSGAVASASIVNSPVPIGSVFPVGIVTILKYISLLDHDGQRSVHVAQLSQYTLLLYTR